LASFSRKAGISERRSRMSLLGLIQDSLYRFRLKLF
jgi:hypothetical protein